MVAFSRFGRNAYKGENSNNIAFVAVFQLDGSTFMGRKSRQEVCYFQLCLSFQLVSTLK